MAGLARKYRGHEHAVALDSTKPITAGGIEEIVVTLGALLLVMVVFSSSGLARHPDPHTLAIPSRSWVPSCCSRCSASSINVLSLLGLVLAIGIVVDDAIVVVEAVQVNMEKGMNAAQTTRHEGGDRSGRSPRW